MGGGGQRSTERSVHRGETVSAAELQLARKIRDAYRDRTADRYETASFVSRARARDAEFRPTAGFEMLHRDAHFGPLQVMPNVNR